VWRRASPEPIRSIPALSDNRAGRAAEAPLITVMGVSGSGKSTVAERLARRLDCPMLEGDSLHSADNIRRMSLGIALTDQDRRDWLAAIALRLRSAEAESLGLVVACSALKRVHRDVLRQAAPRLIFVYLAGDAALLRSRIAARHDHFMPASLLDSQLATLEIPTADERALTCHIAEGPAAIVDSVLQRLPSNMKLHS
jgi:gluconokinase